MPSRESEIGHYMQKCSDLTAELRDAESEITRHHEDFQKLRDLATWLENAQGNGPLHRIGFRQAARAIRDIVG